MHRRGLLQSLAALILTVPVGFKVLAQAKAAVFSRVRPGDAAWPRAAAWQKLNESVGGNLIEVRPLLGACAAAPDAAACAGVMKDMHNPFFIGDQPAGTQVSGWLDAWTPAPSVFAVRARNAADVAAAVNFAREYNLRLVVKGAAHSYLGTSNAPDSLLVWTRAMNRVELHDAFVPKGCEGKIAPTPAVTAEAGAVWIDLYTAVTTDGGRYVQGGGCTDTGVAGLVQSGGFSSHSKRFGTAASGLLEAEIVTADGQVRTVNACNDPELFWAIKGGGGGSWGVVTRLTLRTHALPEHFGATWGTIKANSDEAFRRLIEQFLKFYSEKLFNPNWGEQFHIGSDNTLKLSFVSQGLDSEQSNRVWKDFFDWVKASSQEMSVTEELGTGATAARHWWVVRRNWWEIQANDGLIPDLRAGAPKYHAWWKGDQGQVGAFLHGYDSLWLPETLLREDQRPILGDALFAASRHKTVSLHCNKGLAGAPVEAIAAARDTATNPAVTEAFALAIIADGEAPAYPGQRAPNLDTARKDAALIAKSAAALRRVAPDAGSYVSESNYFNDRWQADYWGPNYARLQAVKAKYDPDGLFFVHHGVGSEAWSADGFTRLT